MNPNTPNRGIGVCAQGAQPAMLAPILPIPAAVDDLGNIIESLRVAVERLEARMESILETTPIKPESPSVKLINDTEGYGLAHKLQARYNRLQSIVSHVENITSRLEL